MKRNVLFSAVFAAVLTWFMLGFSSCTITHEVLLGDVISFSDSANASYTYKKGKMKNLFKQSDPYELYSPAAQNADSKTMFKHRGQLEGNKKKMQEFIDYTRMGNNTAGIYAMDLALDRVKYIKKHNLKRDPNSKYYIIYMTDGLDNISCQVAKDNRQGNYKTPDKYIKKMKKKIAKVSAYKKKTQNPFDIYPVVFTGSDLGAAKRDNNMSDADFDNFIDRNMGWLRGSSRGVENSPSIIKGENFDDVLDVFKDEFNASGFEFHVPKGYVGKRIRMNFSDGVKNTEFSSIFIKKGRKFLLRDISMNNGLESGVKLKPGKTLELKAINNKDKKAKLAIFRLEKPKCEGKSYFINKDLVEQSVDDRGLWLKNSEYSSQSKGAIDTYFILVFDASKSLSQMGFDSERRTALQMIKEITRGALDAEKKVDK